MTTASGNDGKRPTQADRTEISARFYSREAIDEETRARAIEAFVAHAPLRRAKEPPQEAVN